MCIISPFNIIILAMKKTLTLLALTCVAFAGSTFASGQVLTGTAKSTVKSTLTDEQKKAVVACIKIAALTREWYLQSAYRSFTDTVMIAYLRRSEAIDAAYSTTQTMKDARPLIKTAFDVWRDKVKVARDTFNKKRKDVWKTFRNDVNTCKPDKDILKDSTMDSTGQEKSEWSVL